MSLENIQALFDKQSQAATLLVDHLGQVVLGIHQLYHSSPSPESCPHPICESTIKLFQDLEALTRQNHVSRP